MDGFTVHFLAKEIYEKGEKELKHILSKKKRTDLIGYAFILPNLIGVVIFTFLPILYSMVVSFTDWNFVDGIGNWNWVGLDNFIKMWSDDWFVDSFINTIIFAVVTVAGTLSLALVIAVLVDKFCYGKVGIRLALFMPYISNIVAVSIVWVMMYAPWGPFTQLVRALGVDNPPQWLGDEKWALVAVIIMSIWGGIGYAVLIYSAAIQGLPKEVFEAADVDGASEVVKFFKLTLPFLSPTTFFLLITTLIHSFQVFAPIQIMTKGGPGSSSSVLVYYIYESAFTFYKMGYASSMAWMLFVLLFIVTLIQWRGQKKWVNY